MNKTTTKMKNEDSHLILYAKGHYQKSGDIWEDLKKIISERNWVPVECISKQAIFENIIHIIPAYIDFSGYNFYLFMTEIAPDYYLRYLNFSITGQDAEEYDFYLTVVSKCLSLLCFMNTQDKDGNILVELDPADSNILPISKNSRYYKKEGLP